MADNEHLNESGITPALPAGEEGPSWQRSPDGPGPDGGGCGDRHLCRREARGQQRPPDPPQEQPREPVRRSFCLPVQTVSSPVPPYVRSPRTEAQQVQGGNHVLYETQMFFNLAALLDDGRPLDRRSRLAGQDALHDRRGVAARAPAEPDGLLLPGCRL